MIGVPDNFIERFDVALKRAGLRPGIRVDQNGFHKCPKCGEKTKGCVTPSYQRSMQCKDCYVEGFPESLREVVRKGVIAIP